MERRRCRAGRRRPPTSAPAVSAACGAATTTATCLSRRYIGPLAATREAVLSSGGDRTPRQRRRRAWPTFQPSRPRPGSRCRPATALQQRRQRRRCSRPRRLTATSFARDRAQPQPPAASASAADPAARSGAARRWRPGRPRTRCTSSLQQLKSAAAVLQSST